MTGPTALSGTQCPGPMLEADVSIVEAAHGEGRQSWRWGQEDESVNLRGNCGPPKLQSL